MTMRGARAFGSRRRLSECRADPSVSRQRVHVPSSTRRFFSWSVEPRSSLRSTRVEAARVPASLHPDLQLPRPKGVATRPFGRSRARPTQRTMLDPVQRRSRRTVAQVTRKPPVRSGSRSWSERLRSYTASLGTSARTCSIGSISASTTRGPPSTPAPAALSRDRINRARGVRSP